MGAVRLFPGPRSSRREVAGRDAAEAAAHAPKAAGTWTAAVLALDIRRHLEGTGRRSRWPSGPVEDSEREAAAGNHRVESPGWRAKSRSSSWEGVAADKVACGRPRHLGAVDTATPLVALRAA